MYALAAELVHIMSVVGYGVFVQMPLDVLDGYRMRWLNHRSDILTDCYDANSPGAWVQAHIRLGKWNKLYRWGKIR